MRQRITFQTARGEVEAWASAWESGRRAAIPVASLLADRPAARELHAALTGARRACGSRIAADLEFALAAGRITVVPRERPSVDPGRVLPVTDLASLVGADPGEGTASAFIALLLTDADGAPVPGRTVSIAQGGKHVRTVVTSDVGFGDADNLSTEPCDLTFSDLDTRDFAPAVALPGARPSTPVGPVAATAPASAPQAFEPGATAA